MTKKIILAIAFVLVFAMMFSIVAYASTNIEAIKPDQSDTIVIVFPEPVGVIVYPSGVTRQFTSPSPAPIQTDIKEEVIPIEEEIETVEEPPENYDDLIKEIFALVNQARMDAGLETLTYNLDLQYAANVRVYEITQSFSHTRPNGQPFGTAIDLDFAAAGENLIMADDEIADAEVLMDTWMNSEGHRANILSKNFTSMSMGLCKANGVTYVVQLFVKMA